MKLTFFRFVVIIHSIAVHELVWVVALVTVRDFLLGFDRVVIGQVQALLWSLEQITKCTHSG